MGYNVSWELGYGMEHSKMKFMLNYWIYNNLQNCRFIAQDKVQWLASVLMVMNFVSCNNRKFLEQLISIKSSGMTLQLKGSGKYL